MRRAFLIGVGAWIAGCRLAAAQEIYEPVRWQQDPAPAAQPQYSSESVYASSIDRLPSPEPSLQPPAPEPSLQPPAPPIGPAFSSSPGWPAYMPPPPGGPQPVAEPSPAAVEEVPADAPVSPEAPPPVAMVKVAPGPPPKLWEGNFELGLDGSEGNSQTFNVRFGAHTKRKTKYNVLSADLDYHKNSNDSLETANRALMDWRWERLFEPSPWTWFVHGTVDYDEFKAFDVRVAIDTGLGYKFIKTERTTLVSRLGAGTSREIGGPDNQFDPELVFGSEFEHQLTKRQKVTFKFEYIPNVSDFDDYRIRSELGWQVVLDEEMNLSLKASMIDRYDSEPEGALCNDLDYALTLLWSF